MKNFLRALIIVLLTAGTVQAQGVGPANPSTLTWIGPTTNNCTALPVGVTCPQPNVLTDLAGYNIRVAGPLATPTAPCPSYNVNTYGIKKTVPSPTTTPAANTTVKFGTDLSKNLAGDLGLTSDGQYCAGVTAVDLTLNESGIDVPVPFPVNRVPPNVPTNGVANP